MSGTRFDLVAFAGLPGTGKSTIARILAPELGALLLDKDAVRAALFGPSHVTYTAEQDDYVMDVIYRAVEHAAKSGLARAAVLDGRTYTRREHVDALCAVAERADLRLRVIECICDPAVVRERLRSARQSGSHPAADRGPELYDRLAQQAQPLELPCLRLDSSWVSPFALAGLALAYVRAAPAHP
jgi:predicted kinase